MTIRVRFAPSPTGNLHIGSLRVALFNWLYAKHTGGVFLVRIEDTDLERSEERYTQAIYDALAWVQLTPDEPILVQSTRKQEHQALIQKLIDTGKAYKCYCPNTKQDEEFSRYDKTCRLVEPTITNQPFVVRFKVPDATTIVFDDLIHGPISFESSVLDDFVIMRADGNPMYNFVVVADDAFMRITHIMRGDDHISNTPKQILLYQALGFEVPQFAHLPLILGPDGSRLSKRDAATAMMDYKTAGILPDALCNYLVRLGWSHKDQEIFTRTELIEYFTLDAIGKKGAIFDKEKLLWVNSVYLKNTTPEALYTYITELDADFLKNINKEQILAAIALYKERVQTLLDLKKEVATLLLPNLDDLQYPQDYSVSQESTALMTQARGVLENQNDWSAPIISAALKNLTKENNVSLAILGQPLRVALVGSLQAPSIFELLAIIGKKASIARINHFLNHYQESS